MNAEQKQRAAELLAAWRATAYALHADAMAELLQELVDAPETEPVATATGYYAGCLSIATIDGRVLPTGTALYTAPPAPNTAFESETEGLSEFLADLHRSRTKYPNNARMFDGLMGELDELRRAYNGDGDIRAEALDVAVCAFRIAVEGDAGANSRLTAPSVPAMPKLKFVAEFNDGAPVEIEVFGTTRNLNRLAARIEYYENLSHEPPADVARDAEKNRKIAIAAMCCKKITFTEGGPVYDAAGCVMDSFDPEAVVVAGSGQRYVADSIEAALLEMYRAEFEPDAAAIERQGGE